MNLEYSLVMFRPSNKQDKLEKIEYHTDIILCGLKNNMKNN